MTCIYITIFQLVLCYSLASIQNMKSYLDNADYNHTINYHGYKVVLHLQSFGKTTN